LWRAANQFDRFYADLGVRDAEITAHAAFRKRLYDHDVVPEALKLRRPSCDRKAPPRLNRSIPLSIIDAISCAKRAIHAFNGNCTHG
jgi:hypothetical protein